MLTKRELTDNLDKKPYYKVFSIKKIDPNAKKKFKKKLL